MSSLVSIPTCSIMDVFNMTKEKRYYKIFREMYMALESIIIKEVWCFGWERATEAHALENLVPIWWHCLRRIRRNSLVGWGVDIKVSIAYTIPGYLSLCLWINMWAPSYYFSTMPSCLLSWSPPWWPWPYPSDIVWQQINTFFYTLPWSWCLIRKIEK